MRDTIYRAVDDATCHCIGCGADAISMFITDAMNQKLQDKSLPPMIKGCMIYTCGTNQYTVQIFFDPEEVKGNKWLDLSVWAMFKLLPTVGLKSKRYPAIQID